MRMDFEWAKPEWQDRARCKGMPQDGLFFATDSQEKHLELAKAICGRCEVSKECLDYAIEQKIDVGIFGGHTALERKRMRWGRSRERKRSLSRSPS